MSRMNIRISGLGGQGAVTAAHLLAMAANKDGKFSISNPFFGAEKRMPLLKVMPESGLSVYMPAENLCIRT